MENMYTRWNVPAAAMCMEQTGLIYTKEDAPSVNKGLPGSGTGVTSRVESIRSIGRERSAKLDSLWQSENEN